MDGFFFRYGSLVSLLLDKVFRSVAELEQEDVGRLTRRDFTEFMEKISAIPSARIFSEAAVFRNRLSHGSPRQIDKRVERFNEAVERAPHLLNAYNAAYRYTRDRSLVVTLVGGEVQVPEPQPETDDTSESLPKP